MADTQSPHIPHENVAKISTLMAALSLRDVLLVIRNAAQTATERAKENPEAFTEVTGFPPQAFNCKLN